MHPEPTGSLGDRAAQGPKERRASPESPEPRERKEKLAMRETQDQMVPLETGAALGKEVPGGPQVCGAQGETRAKLDPKVTRDERAPLAPLETRESLAPLDLKGTEAMRAPQGSRVPEEPQGPQDPPETPG